MSQKQNDDPSRREFDASRRKFFKSVAKVAYVAPVILTLHATPSFAAIGSICGQFHPSQGGNQGKFNQCENLFGTGA